MLIHCQSDEGLILIPLADTDGSWVFPSDPGPLAGVHFKVKSQLPIIPQIQETIHSRLGIDAIAAGYEVCEKFEEKISTEDGKTISLFVVQSEKKLAATCDIENPPEKSLRFASMPEWLKRLPPTKARVAWVKAWQVYQGVLLEQIKAIDSNDLKAHLNT